MNKRAARGPAYGRAAEHKLAAARPQKRVGVAVTERQRAAVTIAVRAGDGRGGCVGAGGAVGAAGERAGERAVPTV